MSGELDAATRYVVAAIQAHPDGPATFGDPVRVFADLGPEGDYLGPFVVLTVQSAEDVQVTPAGIVMTAVTMLVRVTAEVARMGVTTDGAALVHSALHGTRDTLGPTPGRVHDCRRLQAVRYAEREPSGRVWRHEGGIYRLAVGPTP